MACCAGRIIIFPRRYPLQFRRDYFCKRWILPTAISCRAGRRRTGKIIGKRITQAGKSVAKNGRKTHGKKADYLLRSRFYHSNLAGYFNEYPWWVAHYYQRRPDNDGIAWRFWQHSDRGQVDGINGPVDFNVFNGTVEELQAFVDGIKETP